MKYSNIERLIRFGTTYRRQELADLLEEELAWDLADDIAVIMITMKNVVPPAIWEKVIDNLLRYSVNNQFELIVEREYDEEDSNGTPTGE